MKRQIVITIFLLNFTLSVFATSPIMDANNQLRQVFSNCYDPNTNYLYDRAVHLIDKRFYSDTCTLESNVNIMYYAFDELFNAAFDTTLAVPAVEMLNRSKIHCADTVPVGIIRELIGKIPEDVLVGRMINAFDIKDSAIVPYFQYEYLNMFMVSPLLDKSLSKNPVFYVAPNLMLLSEESAHVIGNEDYVCYIDFGDGNGPINIDLSQSFYYNAHYSTSGAHTITAYWENLSDGISATSYSRIIIGEEASLNTQHFATVKGLHIDEYVTNSLKVFDITSDCNDSHYEKVVFVLAGYNPSFAFNHQPRRIETLYNTYIRDGKLEHLLKFGYRFVIVDWMDPQTYIQENAFHFSQLLNRYIRYRNNEEKFVVIGESMGALIARYALTKMETDKDWAPYRKKLHNTRLFISNDGPHQGVNIPMSLQCLYCESTDYGTIIADIFDFLDLFTRSHFNIHSTLLRSPAVRQMLNCHYEANNNDYYYADNLHYHFFDDLSNIGGYPHFCKNVALTNGALDGARQRNFYSMNNLGNYRNINDTILGIRSITRFEVLGAEFNDTIAFDIKSNPIGYGSYLDVVHTKNVLTIQIGLWYIRAFMENTVVEQAHKMANNLKPYCVMAGGNQYANYKNAWFDFPNYDLDIFLFSLNMSSGNLSVGVNLGIPWLINGGIGLGLHTSGLGFNFVPIASSLDYQHSNEWEEFEYDYTILSAGEFMNHTPFDVVIGRKNDLFENGDHTWTNTGRILTPKTSYSFEQNSLTLLTREIGDFVLYLNNVNLPDSIFNDTIQYSAPEQILRNTHNENYMYGSSFISTFNSDTIVGISKQNPFITKAHVYLATHYHDSFSFTTYNDLSEYICEDSYNTIYHIAPKNTGNHSDEENMLYPTLLESNTTNIVKASYPIISFTLYSIDGQLCYEAKLSNPDSNISIPPLSEQLYLLRCVTEEGKVVMAKINVQ